VELSCKNLSSN